MSDDRYQVARDIARGVRLARDMRMDRWVVLKQTWSEVERGLGNDGHPGLARLLDQTDAGELVFEYCDWPPLSDYLEHSRLDRQWAKTATNSLLTAVEQLHNAGWLHGDLQPDNILVSPSGQVRLIDLSAAHPIDSEATAFHPEYSPPEVLAGHQAGTAADIYSLGRILIQVADRCDRKWSQRLKGSQSASQKSRSCLKALAFQRSTHHQYWALTLFALVLEAGAPVLPTESVREQLRASQTQPLLLRRLDLGE